MRRMRGNRGRRRGDDHGGLRQAVRRCGHGRGAAVGQLPRASLYYNIGVVLGS